LLKQKISAGEILENNGEMDGLRGVDLRLPLPPREAARYTNVSDKEQANLEPPDRGKQNKEHLELQVLREAMPLRKMMCYGFVLFTGFLTITTCIIALIVTLNRCNEDVASVSYVIPLMSTLATIIVSGVTLRIAKALFPAETKKGPWDVLDSIVSRNKT